MTSDAEREIELSDEQRWLNAECNRLGYAHWWVHAPTNSLFLERPGELGKISVTVASLAIGTKQGR